MSSNRTKTLRKQGASRAVSNKPQVNFWPQVLLGLRYVFVIMALSGLGYAGVLLAPKLNPPIDQVVLEGSYQWLDEDKLKEVIYANLEEGILQIDIAQLSAELTSVPWVERAEVLREFPSTLVVRIEEEQAIAQWNDQGYISHLGEFIASPMFAELTSLPRLSSEYLSSRPAEGSREAIELFHLLNSAVLVSGESIAALMQSKAGGWLMEWDSGLQVNLGRIDHLARTRHALAAWGRLPEDDKDEIRIIDARYGNGVAIRRQSHEDLEEIAENDSQEVSQATNQTLSSVPGQI